MHARLLTYLLVTHAAALALALWQLRDVPAVLVGVEVALVGSLLVGLGLWRRTRTQQRLLRDGTAALRDQDYSTRLTPVGVPDLDDLIGVYNALLERIREERVGARRQQFFLSLLVESTNLGVYTMGFDGELLAVNSWGRTLLGIPVRGPLPGHLAEVEHPLAAELVALGEEERRLVRLTDHRRYRCESAYFIDRGFRRRFIIVNDLSGDLAAAEVAAYGQVIRMMAHEVNNAAAASQSTLDTLLDTDDLPDEAFRVLAKAHLPMVRGRLGETNDFMRRFAEVVRVPDPVMADVDLGALLGAQVASFRPLAETSGVTVGLSPKPETTPASIVRADATLLRQVVSNALRNALESIAGRGAGGRIEVSVTEGGFEVADDGPGIGAEVCERLFTPFFSTKPTGQGIGLTLTREILDKHGAAYGLATGADGWTRLRVSFAADGQ